MLENDLLYGERNLNDLDKNIYSKFQCQDRLSSVSSNLSTSESTNCGNGTKLSFCQMSRQFVATTFQRNWTEHCLNELGYDDSLTNLSWLHNVNPIKINEQLSMNPVTFPEEKSNINNHQPRNHVSNNQHRLVSINNEPKILFNSPDVKSLDNSDYKNNPRLKPPFPYAVLISWAMRELGKTKITLSDIYGWIIENFAYYRYSDSSWQNSIRHNLSLGKYFEKVPRRRDEPGKGGFWRINSEHLKTIDINLAKVKHNSSNQKIFSINGKLPNQSNYNQMNDFSMIPENSKSVANNPAHVKRSRKSPIRATLEHFDSEDGFDKINFSQSLALDFNSNNSPYEEFFLMDNHSKYNNEMDLSSNENSSCHSYQHLSKSSSNTTNISMNNLDDEDLNDILASPMLLEKEEYMDNDDFKSIVYANDFSDFFSTSKDDLQDLNSLLGIF